MNISLSNIITINTKCKYCGRSIFEGIIKRYYRYNKPTIPINKTLKSLQFKIADSKDSNPKSSWRLSAYVVECNCYKMKWFFKSNSSNIIETYLNFNLCQDYVEKEFSVKSIEDFYSFIKIS
jgi:hypothetical protein